jgi:hypothetical protein
MGSRFFGFPGFCMPVKKQVCIICALMVMAGFGGCGNQRSTDSDVKRILDSYNSDLTYNFNKAFYFMPLPLYRQLRSAPEACSPDYIRSNLHAVYCVFLKSATMPFIIQLPNRAIFDQYCAKLEKNPLVAKNTLKKLLRFEYAVELVDEGVELVSDHFVYIQEDALINGEPRYWLSEEYYAYFLSDDFTR